MTPPRCPTKNCTSTSFWRLVDAAGRVLFHDAGWRCGECHPPAPGAQHAVETLDVGPEIDLPMGEVYDPTRKGAA